MQTTILIALAALTLVSAQTSNFTINPSEVPLSTRAAWCQGETNSCVDLCDNAPLSNLCDPNTLDFTCTCQNGSAPGLQYYAQTMPTFICNQAFQDCITQNVGNKAGQDNCTTNIKDQCGTLNASALVSGGSSSSSVSATGSATAKTSSGTSAPSSTSKAGAAPTNVQMAGNGIALAAVGLFAYLL